MSTRKHTLLKIAGVCIAAAAAIHIFNRYIESRSQEKGILDRKKALVFHWKYGDIHYTCTGCGSPLLLLHELSPQSSSSEWRRVIDGLSAHHTVYAVDLPGCGASGREESAYSNFLYVQFITDFIRNVIGKPADIAATGLSAGMAVTACRYEAGLIRNIILVNPASPSQLAEVPDRTSRLMKKICDLPLIGTLLYHAAVSRDRIAAEFRDDLFADPSAANADDIDCRYESAHRDRSRGRFLYSAILGRFLNFNINRALTDAENSIFIIGGEKQPGFDATAEEYRSLNPSVRSAVVAGTKHLPQLEKPEAFLEVLHKCLAA